MFKNYRLYRAAIGGLAVLLVCAVVWCFVQLHWPDDPVPHGPQAIPSLSQYQSDNLDQECQELNASPRIPDPNPKQTDDCADKASAQKYNYASLEQSIRSANAAVYSAYTANLQTRIGIIGSILVIASLLFSAAAAWAGIYSARAAVVAADLSRKQLDLAEQANQPILIVKMPISGILVEPSGLCRHTSGPIRMTLVNVGKSPAIVTLIGRSWCAMPSSGYPPPVDVGNITLTKEISGFVIAAGDESIPFNAACEERVSRRHRLFFQGFVNYQDSAGRGYRTIFSQYFSPIGATANGFHITWPPDNPQRYNHHETVDKDGKATDRWKSTSEPLSKAASA